MSTLLACARFEDYWCSHPHHLQHASPPAGIPLHTVILHVIEMSHFIVAAEKRVVFDMRLAGVLERHYELLPGVPGWALRIVSHVKICLHVGERKLHPSLKGLEMQHVRLGVSKRASPNIRGWVSPSLGNAGAYCDLLRLSTLFSWRNPVWACHMSVGQHNITVRPCHERCYSLPP